MSEIVELRKREYDASQAVTALRRLVFGVGGEEKAGALAEAEKALAGLAAQRSTAESKANIGSGRVVSTKEESLLLGAETTGLEVTVDLRMADIPTALVHLFEPEKQPLVVFKVHNASNRTRRLRLICFIEGYTARCVETVELPSLNSYEAPALPTFFPSQLRHVTELTRASVNVEVEDLDAKTEIHRTVPVWLLARTTAPLAVQDPSTGEWRDLTRYLGAYVTPNAPEVMQYLRAATDMHPQQRMIGYQGSKGEVAPQVEAVYAALAKSKMRYVNSIIDFTPETGSANQRVRLPRESLANTSANCIDGTVLMASVLEAASLNPAIVLVPGHAFLGWETWKRNDEWKYVETTMIPTDTFVNACAYAEGLVAKWSASAEPLHFRRYSLRDLRAAGITPLE
jgi:hypothetical protein